MKSWIKPYNIYQRDSNRLDLMFISSHFMYEDGYFFLPDELFTSRVGDLVSEHLAWRSEIEVVQELERLFLDDEFVEWSFGSRDNVRYAEVCSSRFSELIVRREEFDQRTKSYIEIEDQCAHYFMDLTISRSSIDFAYFFSIPMWGRNFHIIDPHLRNHLDNEFYGNLKEFAHFVLYCQTAHAYFWHIEVISFVKNWIDVELQVNRQQHSMPDRSADAYIVEPYALEVVNALAPYFQSNVVSDLAEVLHGRKVNGHLEFKATCRSMVLIFAHLKSAKLLVVHDLCTWLVNTFTFNRGNSIRNVNANTAQQYIDKNDLSDHGNIEIISIIDHFKQSSSRPLSEQDKRKFSNKNKRYK